MQVRVSRRLAARLTQVQRSAAAEPQLLHYLVPRFNSPAR